MPNTKQPEASHYINGQYVEDSAGTELVTRYPVTGEVVASLYAATDNIVDHALAAADAARASWAAMTGSERGRILRRAADIIRERNRELSVLETLDTGKPLQETLVADAASGADCLEYFGAIAAGLTGEHIQLGKDFAYTIREPLGVCVGIGAWNYPIQIACWKAAPALACGNTLVF
jgi:betaine-aldehyde dehydrogenase